MVSALSCSLDGALQLRGALLPVDVRSTLGAPRGCEVSAIYGCARWWKCCWQHLPMPIGAIALERHSTEVESKTSLTALEIQACHSMPVIPHVVKRLQDALTLAKGQGHQEAEQISKPKTCSR